MMTLSRVRFLSSTFVRDIVKNPICLDCTHYMEYKHSNPYDELYEKYKLGKCGFVWKTKRSDRTNTFC